ncbi:class B sortase [Slackia heliotrinireducens]|uniref:class B sortase n=1 Tax=Slackia heliotrinireducens TaxID=84110 RepID=UPI0033151E81
MNTSRNTTRSTRGVHARHAAPAASGRTSQRDRAAEEVSQYSRASYGSSMAQQRTRRKTTRVLNVVIALASLVLIGSLGALGYIFLQYHQGTALYDGITDGAVVDDSAFENPDESGLENLIIDWEFLRNENADVVGWVYVPGTEINYPIAQTTDNSTYLVRDFTGSPGSVVQKGTIFLDKDNASDFSDKNNVIYGHNMHDGSMFSHLHDMREEDVFNETRTFYILTPTMNYKCSTFALDIIPETEFEMLRVAFDDDTDFYSFVNDCVNASSVPIPDGVDATQVEKMFSLVSCAVHGDGTRVVLRGFVAEQAAPANAESGTSDGADETVNEVGEGLAEDEAAVEGEATDEAAAEGEAAEAEAEAASA